MNNFSIRSYRGWLRATGVFASVAVTVCVIELTNARWVFWTMLSLLLVFSILFRFYKEYTFSQEGLTVYLQNHPSDGAKINNEATEKSALYREYALNHLRTDYGQFQSQRFYSKIGVQPFPMKRFTLLNIPKHSIEDIEYIPRRFNGILLIKLRGCKIRTEKTIWMYRLHNCRNLLVIFINNVDATGFIRLMDDYLKDEKTKSVL